MSRCVLAISWPEPVKRSLRINMGTRYVNRADRRHGSNIRIKKGRTDDWRDQIGVAVPRDWGGLAIGNSKSRHLLLLRAEDRFDGISQALTEANRHQHIFG